MKISLIRSVPRLYKLSKCRDQFIYKLYSTRSTFTTLQLKCFVANTKYSWVGLSHESKLNLKPKSYILIFWKEEFLFDEIGIRFENCRHKKIKVNKVSFWWQPIDR